MKQEKQEIDSFLEAPKRNIALLSPCLGHLISRMLCNDLYSAILLLTVTYSSKCIAVMYSVSTTSGLYQSGFCKGT